jgi:YbbR domain-containing protein
MQPTPENTPLRVIVLNNILWFIGSLLLAALVWLIAVVQNDPVTQAALSERVPIRVIPNPALVLTNQNELPSLATVTVRAPGSVLAAMNADDITLTLDLSTYTPGTHTVPITAVINPDKRASIVRISPRTWAVRLEPLLAQLKPVRTEITSQPGALFAVSAPTLDVVQAEVSGAQSRVSRVAEVVARVGLAEVRGVFDDSVPLLALDAAGEVVGGVTISPAAVRVRIEVQQRADVVELRVQPNIIGELPPGYLLTPDFSYSPQSILLRAPRAVLDTLPGMLFTEPIDLSDQRESFSITVPVILPDPRLLVLTGGGVTVNIGIAAQQVTRQFDRVPLTLIGESAELSYTLTPAEVTLLLTGPQPLLDELDASELGALVDVGGIPAGASVQIAPVSNIGQNERITVSVLPAQVGVSVTDVGG